MLQCTFYFARADIDKVFSAETADPDTKKHIVRDMEGDENEEVSYWTVDRQPRISITADARHAGRILSGRRSAAILFDYLPLAIETAAAAQIDVRPRPPFTSDVESQY